MALCTHYSISNQIETPGCISGCDSSASFFFLFLLCFSSTSATHRMRQVAGAHKSGEGNSKQYSMLTKKLGQQLEG